MRRLAPTGVLVGAFALVALAAPARAEDRPNEQDMFGAGASAPTPAAPDAGAPGGDGGSASALGPVSPASEAASAAGGTERDQSLLGSAEGGPAHLSDYQAPDNPLAIGGQLYLRAQSSAQEDVRVDRWSLTAPSLLDLYLDARPNPRVRAFIRGRMSFDPTAPPGSATASALQGGSGGAFSGGSATGFTTFSAARGPTSVLDQMWIRFDVKQRLFVTAGKQHVRWGTGRFWQPTDYLHGVKRNPLDVFDARPGQTMVKLHLPWEDRGWNFYAFGVLEDPNEASNSLRRVAGAARAELVLGAAELGLDALVKAGQRPRYGVDLSAGIWELDVYGDVGIRSGEDFCAVHPTTGMAAATGGGSCPAPGMASTNPDIMNLASMYALAPLSGVKVQAVGGVNWSHKYNDNDLLTIGGEYFYNQPGYSDAGIYPGLLFNSNYTPLLNFFYTGRHYAALFASFPMPYSWNLTTFTLSTLANLTDQSFISRLDYSYTLLTHLSLEAFAGVHYGHAGGEFRLGFDLVGFHNPPAVLDLGLALRMKI